MFLSSLRRIARRVQQGSKAVYSRASYSHNSSGHQALQPAIVSQTTANHVTDSFTSKSPFRRLFTLSTLEKSPSADHASTIFTSQKQDKGFGPHQWPTSLGQVRSLSTGSDESKTDAGSTLKQVKDPEGAETSEGKEEVKDLAKGGASKQDDGFATIASYLAPHDRAGGEESEDVWPTKPEEIPDDFFTNPDDLDEDEFYSLLLHKDLRGVPGLPPLPELRAMDEGAEEKAERREMERLKQEADQRSRVKVVDDLGRSYATGRRKCSVARVWLMEGEGRIIVNSKPHDLYFPELGFRTQLLLPFVTTSTLGDFDVWSTVTGGGRSGQAGAMRHGISRALQLFDPALRPALKAAGFLTRDSRVVERKKPGKAKARKSFQWVKR